ncbi:MAG: gluconate 2-dehydrogenase subunit 3 family protein [Bacteroidota bacterium]|nr:gluconate 2-dehydrogenase subunit 3 family protein [Bacteroidota bacterium]
MDRREALKRTALLMGGAVSAPAIMGILKGCAPKPGIDWKPVFLKEDQASIISTLSDIIIPRTDTPGAVDAGVPGFIDQMLKEVYKEEDQKFFMDGLVAFNEGAKSGYGDAFADLDEDDQAAYVKTVHNAAVDAEKTTEPAPKRPFILMMKELTMLGFFTSEPGATQVLQYVAVPGAYKGCIPLSEAGNGKTWAT